MTFLTEHERTLRQKGIIEASVSSFAEKGCFAFRMEDVAEKAVVAKGCIYLHFESKKELLAGCLGELHSDVLSEYERRLHGLRGEATAVRKLALIAEGLLKCNVIGGDGFCHPLLQRLTCSLENLGHEEVPSPVGAVVATVIEDDALAGLLGWGLSSAALAELFVGTVNSRIVRAMALQDGVPKAAQCAVNFFLRGMGLSEGVEKRSRARL